MCKTAPSKLFQEQIKDWLYSIIETSETECHELDSFQKLKNFINDVEKTKKASLSSIAFTRNCIIASYVPMLPKISFRHCIHKEMGMIDHNYFRESENSALSRDYAGPKPNNILHVACDSIINHIKKGMARCFFIYEWLHNTHLLSLCR